MIKTNQTTAKGGNVAHSRSPIHTLRERSPGEMTIGELRDELELAILDENSKRRSAIETEIQQRDGRGD